MKNFFLVALPLVCFLFSDAQIKIKNKKYPSLFWEITGPGLSKPSYLFGTMHVSSKMVFHLPDSFYLAIRSADVVALETNPESWQEDMTKFDMETSQYKDYLSQFSGYREMPSDYLNIHSLQFNKYDKQIELALFMQPSAINNLLYRSYSFEGSDFEEDTYLDMYIYQCGKKMGKRVAGVENYAESMKLMMEAYSDAAKDKNRKERSYEMREDISTDKLQEAYRNGNLDLLDSINKLNSFSDVFDEKFLYKRNEIQANHIDSIIRSKSSLFVGVGAAHLPGTRGVIELLRKKGYKLRPIIMGERDSKQKDIVEKIRVPVTFTTHTEPDGFFKVDMPGKFYRFNKQSLLDQQQYADMANGSYYLVTRIKTNSLLWGQSTDDVYKKIDSLLYENIPGKILSRTDIIRNGYRGLDITNRTRRGDFQRYNIFITPYEIILFKMSGNGDYVKNGEEAKRFFSSIQLKEFKNTGEWKTFMPSYGGFSVLLPHDAFESADDNHQYDAEDKASGTHFTIVRTDIHNYHFTGEDTFDLDLLDESFASSDFIDKSISHHRTTFKGYPALDCKYLHKDSSVFIVRFILQGPHYYTLLAHAKKENEKMQAFFNSFAFQPFVYGAIRDRMDTALYYSVKSPVFNEPPKEKLALPQAYSYNDLSSGDDDVPTEQDLLASGVFRGGVIADDTTGEKVFVAFYKSPEYYYTKDSSKLDDEQVRIDGDSTWIIRMRKKYELPGSGMKVWEVQLSDSGSSRMLWAKNYYKDGVGFSLMTETDTLTQPSSFIKNFFASFNPADTLKGYSPFVKKSNLFFNDFFSRDSVAHKRAIKNIDQVYLDSSDLSMMKKAISSLTWSDQKYLDTKKGLIGKLRLVKNKACSDYLKDVYYAAGDTVELQYAALRSLLKQETSYAYTIFRDIIVNEPPVLENSQPDNNYYRNYIRDYVVRSGNSYDDYEGDDFMDALSDSLQLTHTILPDILPLINLDDYKEKIMQLIGDMVDSNLVKPKDYDIYFSKFLIEAKQELRKQAIAEKKKAIEKAQKLKDKTNTDEDEDNDKPDNDDGNDDLSLYAKLLLPYYDVNISVPPVFGQMLSSSDKKLKYSTMLLLLKSRHTIPDTLLNYFASMDDYRYELYNDLKEMKMRNKFPAKFNNHLDLGKSRLLDMRSYNRPDSIVYLNRLSSVSNGRKGFVYFYKYKLKKDDLTWRLATVGLMPEDSSKFEFDDPEKKEIKPVYYAYSYSDNNYSTNDFTSFSDEKIKDDEPLMDQLKKLLKKMEYSQRKSGVNFYNERNYNEYGMNMSKINIGN
ncbi:MAG: TraB/GumN family protein [Bacteroidetes bacterium]|nr:TraB/GumN family protein [Bacteroidota bacterium]